MKKETLDKLKNIPHLELDFQFNFERLKAEVLAANNKWYGYMPPFMNEHNMRLLGMKPDPEEKKMYDTYQHCSLITYHPGRYAEVVSETFAWSTNPERTQFEHYYNLPYEQRKWYYTPEAEKFPYLKEIVSQITDHPELCKLIRSQPGNWLGWHSHQKDPVIRQYDKPEQCILHIPIIQHEDVAFLVSKNMPSNRSHFDPLDTYRNDPNSFVGSYTPGKVYFFNGTWPHAFKNYSNEDRLDIVLYSDTTVNDTLENLISRSIDKYTGPYIEN